MAKRKALGKKIRFEVFKRDLFTCQYCGRKAPDIVLNADHIKPVAKGGSDKIENLVTSCFDCNSGKSDREISDSAVIDKSKAQLKITQEKIDEIKMMSKLAESIAEPCVAEWEAVNNLFSKLTDGYVWEKKYHYAKVVNMCKKYGLSVVLQGVSKGLEYANPEEFTMAVLNNACKIISDPPYIGKSKYCRAIYKNRFGLNYKSYNLIESRVIEMFNKYGIEKTVKMFMSKSEDVLDLEMDIHNV